MLLCFVCVFLTVLGASHGKGEDSEIAFSAGLDHHAAVNGGEKVVYNRIFSNVGGAYSTSTGVFSCPRAGIYVFQVHTLSRNNSDTWLEMHHNYHYVMSIWGHTDNDYSASGNSAILQLTAGDEVFVTSTDGYLSEIYGQAGEVYATFSGYLISAVYQEFPVGG